MTEKAKQKDLQIPAKQQAQCIVRNFMIRAQQIISTFFLLLFSAQLSAQENNASPIDSSIYSQKIVTIQGKTYNGFLNPNGFQLLNSKDKIYVTHSGDYSTWEFKDFNKDGYKDIFLDKGGNTSERFDLLLYVPTKKIFRQVEDFENFPTPENISGTNYFYSYHKSGCADMNWDSDLFYLKDFKAIRLANISGRECANSGTKNGLYISKISKEKKIPYKTLSIGSVHKFKDDKWEFIKKYWTENYKLFL